MLWERLRKHQLNGWGFRRQSPVGEYVVDFLRHTPPLIVEVDGPAHEDGEQKTFDAMRDEKLAQKGYIVLRVKERFVRERMLEVESWISRRGEQLLAGKVLTADERRLDNFPLP